MITMQLQIVVVDLCLFEVQASRINGRRSTVVRQGKSEVIAQVFSVLSPER